MSFRPVEAAKAITQAYHDYVKTTFFIRDDELRRLFEDELDRMEFAKGPYIEAVDAFETGRSIDQLVADGVLSAGFRSLFNRKPGILNRPLYLHQEQSIVHARLGRNLVVTTGTGSGKTESFLFPILDHLLRQKEALGSIPAGVQALLLYPMNALANDQMTRLRDLLADYPEVTFGSYTGETENTEEAAVKKYREANEGKSPITNEFLSRDRMKQSPPHLLITNYAMLEYLLLRPADNVFFHGPASSNWKYIVLDEAHVYTGAAGMEVAILLRRLYHSLPDPKKVRFILTSATLGGPESGSEVVNFATNLCAGTEFGLDDVIRATRKVFSPGLVCQALDPSSLAALEQNYSGDSEALYSRLEVSDLYCRLRETVGFGTLPIVDLASRLDLTEVQVSDLVRLVNLAKREGSKLMDIRFHLFIRTLEGAYVTFFPQKTLTTVPRKEAKFGEETFRAFKISVCQYCGELYLEGRRAGGILDQSSIMTGEYYMLVDDEFMSHPSEDDAENLERQKRTFQLCCRCGSLVPAGARSGGCSCKPDGKIMVFQIEAGPNQDEMHKCQYCQATNSRGSILRGFYLGQNAAAAVIGSSLYEELPVKEIRLQSNGGPKMGRQTQFTEMRKTKQLLVFSDSRQEAAYFAPYFEFTHNNILRRRMILKTCVSLAAHPAYENGIPLPIVAKELARNLELEDLERPEECEREAWKSLIYELRAGDRNGLVNLGLVSFRFISNFQLGHKPFPDPVDLATLDELLMASFLREGAVSCPIQLTKEDVRYFMYHGNSAVFRCGPNDGQPLDRNLKVNWWLSRSSNYRIDLLRKTGAFSSDQQIFDFAKLHFETKTEDNTDQFQLVDGAFQLRPVAITVKVSSHHRTQWYRCDVCGRLTDLNLHNICPQFRCRGSLLPQTNSEAKGYFQSRLGAQTVFPMRVKEHTAQLQPQTAREYQNDFIRGKTQVLSSSTTFEMGVDVGRLDSVFMRNMPPSPANYIQRAGRAGRRADSEAFALTFCRLASHDMTYFKSPDSMIKGVIFPPDFKVDNLKIVRRHIYAALLAGFWRRQPSLSSVSEIFSDAVLETFKGYLADPPREVLQYVRSFVPSSIDQTAIDELIDLYCSDSGFLSEVVEGYRKEVRSIQIIIEDLKADGDYGSIIHAERALRTLESTKIIEHFSRNNLIPKYGFPVDTVELRTDLLSLSSIRNKTSRLRLQRDLYQAISEYAPESEVVADGFIYTSAYVRKPVQRDRTWKQYRFEVCSNPSCKTMNLQTYAQEGVPGPVPGRCVACGQPVQMAKVFIEPKDGFSISLKTPVASTTKTLKRTSRSRIFYVGRSVDPNLRHSDRTFELNGIPITIRSAENDTLAVINNLSFLVCPECGFSVKNERQLPSARKEHRSPLGKDCFSTLVGRSLGHTFQTDVAVVGFGLHLGDEAISVLYALLEGISRHFHIDRDDIDGCVSYQNFSVGSSDTAFIIFDKVPGGAGNVARVGKASHGEFVALLRGALSVVDSCDCGDHGDGNAACYGCLCNYFNQPYHEMLSRKSAGDFLRKLV